MDTAGTGSGIQWQARMLSVTGSKELWSPYADVEFTDGRGDGKKLEGRALLDTGAARTACSKAFADQLWLSGVVTVRDITRGSEYELTLADSSMIMKPLGSFPVLH